MTGHLLSHPRLWCGIYRARCGCGWDLFHATLPKLWEQHDRHLDAVRAAARAGHPSNGRRP